MSLLSRLVVIGLLFFASAIPALAGQPRGSAGWTTDGWTTYSGTLHQGPGKMYDVTGSIEAGVRVRVDRCTEQWCQIHTRAVRGWLPQSNVSFGQKPDGLLVGPKFAIQRGGPGYVCFFDGANYTGHSVCAKSGKVWKDLALFHRDNTISSIEIGVGVSALVCRDRNFRSYCKVIDVSTGNLEGLLNNGISSVRVY